MLKSTTKKDIIKSNNGEIVHNLWRFLSLLRFPTLQQNKQKAARGRDLLRFSAAHQNLALQLQLHQLTPRVCHRLWLRLGWPLRFRKKQASYLQISLIQRSWRLETYRWNFIGEEIVLIYDSFYLKWIQPNTISLGFYSFKEDFLVTFTFMMNNIEK